MVLSQSDLQSNQLKSDIENKLFVHDTISPFQSVPPPHFVWRLSGLENLYQQNESGSFSFCFVSLTAQLNYVIFFFFVRLITSSSMSKHSLTALQVLEVV